MLTLGLLLPTTYDMGDSITHHLMARWAPVHPYLYLDHWGKPFFTLLASPWAYFFGFAGTKVFNVLCTWGAGILTRHTGQAMGIGYAWLIPWLTLFSPELFLVSHSGLTEPLLLLQCMLALWAVATRRWWWLAAALAFMPYVRSEGMVLQLVFLTPILWARQWRLLPLVVGGYVIYGLIGWLVLDFPFHWYFVHNPYDGMAQEVYGTGSWLRFVEGVWYVLGLPLGLLCYVGVFRCGWVLTTQGLGAAEQRHLYLTRHLLLPGVAMCMVAVHTYFWAVGGFNSFGLLRVLIPTAMAMLLLSLEGAQWLIMLAKSIHKQAGKAVLLCTAGYTLLFPFMPNHMAYQLPGDFTASPHQLAARQAAQYIEDYKPKRIYCQDPYTLMLLDLDPINTMWVGQKWHWQEGDLLLLNHWFATTDLAKVNLPTSRLRLLKYWNDEKGNLILSIYTYKTSTQ